MGDITKKKNATEKQKQIYRERMEYYRNNPDPSVMDDDGNFDEEKASDKAEMETYDIEFHEFEGEKERLSINNFENVHTAEKERIENGEIRKGDKTSYYIKDFLDNEENGLLSPDILRFSGKNTIGAIAKNYKKYTENFTENDELTEVRELLDDVDRYAKLTYTYADVVVGTGPNGGRRRNATAIQRVTEEKNLQKQIIDKSKDLYKKLADKYKDSSLEDSPVVIDGKIEYESQETKQWGAELKMVSGILTYFDSLKSGNLMPPEDEVINYSKTEIENIDFDDENIPLGEDEPLFTHEPSPDDLVQGGLGDCYFIAGLASLARTNSQLIKDSIVDNGDGTCTVRFYNKVAGTDGTGADDTFEPVYIKVDKSIPQYGGAKNSAPWVGIMERAYAASGRYIKEKNGLITSNKAYQKAQDFKELYKKLKSKDRSDWPSHEECPALIDEEGNLHPYTPTYAQIESGVSANVIEIIGGPNYKAFIKREPLGTNSVAAAYLNDFFSSMYRNSGVEVSDPRQDWNYAHDKENLELEDYAKILYIAENGKEPPKLADGSINLSNIDVAMAFKFAELIKTAAENTERYITNGVIPNEKDIKNLVQKEYGILFNEYVTKESNNILKSVLKLENGGFGKYIGKIEESFDAFNLDVQKNYSITDRRSGEYNEAQKKLFDDIKAALANNENVVLGTKANGRTDQDKIEGLHCDHAYTVEGVTTKIMGGREYNFLIVRNPHATDKGRIYEFDEGKDRVVAREADTKNGISYIELSDLADCANVGINRKNVYERNIGVQKLDVSTLSNYSRVLETFEKELKSAYRPFGTKDSQEYKNLRTAVSNMKINIEVSFGKGLKEIFYQAKKVQAAADAYMKHCAGVKTPGTIRQKRMGITRGLQMLTGDIIESFQNGKPLKDPKGKLKDEMAEKILTGINKYLHDKGKRTFGGRAKDKMLETIKNEPAFKNNIGKGNYLSLLVNSKLKASELANRYMRKAPKIVEPPQAENVIEDKNAQLEKPAVGNMI